CVKVRPTEASHWRWQEGRSAVNAHRIFGEAGWTARNTAHILQVFGGISPSVEPQSTGDGHVELLIREIKTSRMKPGWQRTKKGGVFVFRAVQPFSGQAGVF